MRIGFLGGSFDPVHVAHLVMAESCLDQQDLDEVRFVVAASPPHKLDRRLAAPEHRLAMVRLAVQGNPRLAVDDREMRRQGPSFTIETIRELIAEHSPEDRLFWIIGADSLPELTLWRNITELLDLVTFLTVLRPGFPVEPALAALEGSLGRNRVRRLAAGVVAIPLLEVSSTDLRRRVREGRSIRYLLPDAVGEYLRRHRLYSA